MPRNIRVPMIFVHLDPFLTLMMLWCSFVLLLRYGYYMMDRQRFAYCNLLSGMGWDRPEPILLLYSSQGWAFGMFRSQLPAWEPQQTR